MTDPAGVSLTVTSAVPSTDPEVAVTVTEPSATDVKRPADETVTIPVFDDDHITVELAIVLSLASFTVAVSVVVPPIDMSVSVLGDRVTEFATWVTVTVTVSLPAPDVAVIVAVPLAFEVTSPAEETVVIVISEDAHTTVAPAIVLSFASLTVAARVAVSANEAKLRLVGDRVTELAS